MFPTTLMHAFEWNYCEQEPESESSSSSNRKNSTDKALVRRITNELQVAQLEKEKLKANGDAIKVASKISKFQAKYLKCMIYSDI